MHVKSAVRRADAIVGVTTLTSGVLGAVGLVLIMLATIANVIAREAFNGGIPSAVEGSQELLVICVFLGFGTAQREGKHVATRVLTDHLTGWPKTAVRLIGLLASFVLALWLVWGTGKEAQYSVSIHEQVAGLVTFPAWPARIVVTVGCILLAAEIISSIVRLLASDSKPAAPPRGADSGNADVPDNGTTQVRSNAD
jgi:TRAP-type C4-dicarboxylate transport system permease small subunit